MEMPDSVIIEQLAKGRVDMAVLPAFLDSARFSGVPIMTARHCLLVHKSHPLAGKTSIRYSDLAVSVTLDYIAASDPRPSTVVIPFADKNYKRVLYAARRKEDTWDGAASFMKDMLIEHFRCYSSN